MEKAIKQGPLVFAVSVLAFGVLNLVSAHSLFKLIDTVHLPVIPWVPAHPWMGYLTGAAFFLLGLALLFQFHLRATTIALGVGFLFFAAALLPLVIKRPSSIGLRTLLFENLAMGATAFMLADRNSENPRVALGIAGRYLFSFCLLVFGIDHFLKPALIASFVPSWMPGPTFWAYFTGTAFIAAAVSLATRWQGVWGGFFLGLMFLLWVVLLHAPRVSGLFNVGDGPRSPDEWSSLWIAAAMWGAGWIGALSLSERRDSRFGSEEGHFRNAKNA